MKRRNQKQPWNETFSDVRDSSGHLSRMKLHRQNHNNNVITLILVVIIGLIALFALIYGLASNSLGQESSHRKATRVSEVSHRHHHKSRGHKHKSRSDKRKSHKLAAPSTNDRLHDNNVGSTDDSSDSSASSHKTPASSKPSKNGTSNNTSNTKSNQPAKAPSSQNNAKVNQAPSKK